jgi:hypothetical protein
MNPLPGRAATIRTFGDLLGFNPHCHILITDGCFLSSRMRKEVRVRAIRRAAGRTGVIFDRPGCVGGKGPSSQSPLTRLKIFVEF